MFSGLIVFAKNIRKWYNENGSRRGRHAEIRVWRVFMRRRTRKLSIKMKILLSTSFMMVCLFLVLGVSFYKSMERNMIAMGVEQAQVAAKVAVGKVDASVADLQPGDEETENYERLLYSLREAKSTCNMAYLYTLSTDGSQVFYGIDTDETDARNAIGDVFEYPYEELRPVFEGEMYVQDYIDSTEDGDLITVYIPVLDGKNRVAAVLGSDYDASEIMERLNRIRLWMIQISIIGVLIALVVIHLIIRTITSSLWKVNQKIYELVNSEGDLTQKLQVRTGDEMELMADNVNALLKYIREIMLHISDDSNKLNESTKIVFGNLTSAGENVMEVSSTMEQMSAAMEESTATLNQIGESVGEVYTNINYIAEKAETGNHLTKDIKEKAQKIYDYAEEAQDNAHTVVMQLADSVNEKIKKSKSVGEINRLTEDIISITGQTNLLALNASIEAARAGEAGKGFAVVADEIGKLASTSANTASQIKQISAAVIGAVEGLALEAEKMLQCMEETAMEGYRKLLSTSQGYREDAENIHGMMENFAEDSERLEQAINDMKDALQSVSTAVEENARGVVNVSEVSAQLTESMRDIEKRADLNKKIGEQLAAEVGKFKLE